jgi:hypothetical protein
LCIFIEAFFFSFLRSFWKTILLFHLLVLMGMGFIDSTTKLAFISRTIRTA